MRGGKDRQGQQAQRDACLKKGHRPGLFLSRLAEHVDGNKGEGQCRACLVLLDGEPAMSCLLPVTAVEGKSITTIEGLAEGDTLHLVQQAFLEEEAMQCGYCTGGMILSAVALLREKPDLSDEDIVRGMNGNLCRCNEYVKITAAVRNAARRMKERSHEQ